MPLIFEKISLGAIFGCMWFLLLFLAGITSSISLAQPTITFLEDEFNISKKKAVIVFGTAYFILCQSAIFFLKNGAVNELDFWGGTFCLVLFATIETVLFGWIFGIEKAWEEIHHGAEMQVPKIYKFIIKYITPLFLLFILGFWFYQEGIPTILMKGTSPEDKPYMLGIRLMLLGIFLSLAILVKIAWRKRKIAAKK
jgi:SNF family Na+-dependent transporter